MADNPAAVDEKESAESDEDLSDQKAGIEAMQLLFRDSVIEPGVGRTVRMDSALLSSACKVHFGDSATPGVGGRNITSALRGEDEAMSKRPEWHSADYDSTWDRIKAAFANDWEQTKADFGSDDARDMDQDVDDTLKQMVGSDDAFENREQAFRFGNVAHQHYGNDYPEWNDELDRKLRADYDGDYDADRRYIRHSYEYKY